MSQKWTFYILRYIWGKKIHNSQWVHNEFSMRKQGADENSAHAQFLHLLMIWLIQIVLVA